MNRSSRPGPATLAAIVAAAAITLAACGGGSSSPAASSHSPTAAAGRAGFNATKFRACLKSHGVTLPARPPGARSGAARPGTKSGTPRPATTGRPGGFRLGHGGPFANPKFRAALQACGGARFQGARRFAPNHAAVVKFVACVRKHGYDLPTPNFSGHGSIFSPSIARNSRFQAASRACASLLRPSRAPRAGAGPPGSAPPRTDASPGSTTPTAGT